MIFLRTLLREFANLAVAVFLSLFLIALTTRLIRLLGQAAGGKIPSDAVVAFLGFSALNLLPVLLSLTLFISVLLALNRAWRDSEMVIWFNSGLSLAAWLRPVLIFAAPLVFLIALLSFFISPWSAQMSEHYRSRIDSRDDLSRVEPGAFGESRSKERVFFVESIAGDKSSVQNVFVNSLQHRRTGVMMSERGFTEYAPNGDRFLILEDGRRYDGNWGGVEYTLMEFERYGVRLENAAPPTGTGPARGLTTPQLLGDLTSPNLGELMSRIGLPVSVIVISLLAIPLAFVNPRLGQSFNIVIGVLIYFTYTNLNGLMRSWIAQDRVSFSLGVWITHAVIIAITVYLFHRRLYLPQLSLGRLIALARGAFRSRPDPQPG